MCVLHATCSVFAGTCRPPPRSENRHLRRKTCQWARRFREFRKSAACSVTCACAHHAMAHLLSACTLMRLLSFPCFTACANGPRTDFQDRHFRRFSASEAEGRCQLPWRMSRMRVSCFMPFPMPVQPAVPRTRMQRSTYMRGPMHALYNGHCFSVQRPPVIPPTHGP